MNSKRTIMILILVLTIGIVGLTLAYFSNSSTVNNIFTTQPYGTTVTENFTSPSNWLPGQEVDKTVVATNTGNVDEAVRISLSESWTTANHGTLNGWITSTGTKSSHLPENEPSTDERVAIINFDNASDWTYNNGYYYYNYKLSPTESTSSLIKSVTFNSKTKLDDTCVETPTATGRTITCNSSGDDYDDATYTLTFNIETVQYNKYSEAWSTDVAIASEKPSSGVDTLLEKTNSMSISNYMDGDIHEMYTFNHEATEQTPALTDYRYIGNNPYNYVKFNCDNDGTNCEVWRIIGVFDVDDGNGNYEQRIKLVRGSTFDSEITMESDINNNWAKSKLNEFLNDKYYNKNGDAASFGLKSIARSQIDDVIYYLGEQIFYVSPINTIEINGTNYVTTEEKYIKEREREEVNIYEVYCSYDHGDDRCSIENYCENNLNDGLCDTTKSSSWKGKISIMYPSDLYYVYANGVDEVCFNNPTECYYQMPWESSSRENPGYPQNGWIYSTNSSYLLLSPNIRIAYNNTIYFNTEIGNEKLNSKNIVENLIYRPIELSTIRPVVYLKPSIQIISGTGQENDPYVLSN